MPINLKPDRSGSQGDLPKRLKFHTREVQNVLVIELLGKLVGSPDSYRFREMIDGKLLEGQRLFLIDLSSLKLVNSLGIGLLLICLKRVTDAGGSLLICGIHSRIAMCFRVPGLVSPFDSLIYDSCEEALQDLFNRQQELQPPGDS